MERSYFVFASPAEEQSNQQESFLRIDRASDRLIIDYEYGKVSDIFFDITTFFW